MKPDPMNDAAERVSDTQHRESVCGDSDSATSSRKETRPPYSSNKRKTPRLSISFARLQRATSDRDRLRRRSHHKREQSRSKTPATLAGSVVLPSVPLDIP